jgi:hypothetical protein
MAVGSAVKAEGQSEFIMYVPVQDKAPHKQQVCVGHVHAAILVILVSELMHKGRNT